jgi:hypothetical protein
VALVIASSVWKHWMPNSVVWTEEQATRHQEAGARFHQAAHAHGAHRNHVSQAQDESTTAAELAVAEKAYKDHKAQLDQAIARRVFWEKLLRRGGIVAIAVGAIGYFVAKNIIDDQE